MGTLLGFPDGASSPPDYSEDPTSWICFLHGLSGKPMRLQMGEKTFQLSSDTIYFLEDLGTGIPAAGPIPDLADAVNPAYQIHGVIFGGFPGDIANVSQLNSAPSKPCCGDGA